MWAAVYRKGKDKIKLITNGLGKGTLPKERGKEYVNYLGLKIQLEMQCIQTQKP